MKTTIPTPKEYAKIITESFRVPMLVDSKGYSHEKFKKLEYGQFKQCALIHINGLLEYTKRPYDLLRDNWNDQDDNGFVYDKYLQEAKEEIKKI